MAVATKYAAGTMIEWTADASYSAGCIIQLNDGRAGVIAEDVTSGNQVGVHVAGIFLVTKTANFVFLTGGRIYLDHSAQKAHYLKVNDRDFYIGRAAADATSAATTCYVDLNIDPPYDVDVHRDGFLAVPTGTKAAGAFGFPKVVGGANILELTATNEAQCIDMLSVDRFAIGSNWIAELIIRPAANGSGSTVDINFGVANATSTTDADAIAESCFFHIDGGTTTILAESDDGTTENNAATTATSITAGTAVANRVEFWLDGRNSSDVQLYINGANVMGSTTFTFAAGTGPLGLLAHLEKTSGTETGNFIVDEMRVRLGQI